MNTTMRAMTATTLLAACLAAQAMPGLAADHGDGWPMFKGDAARTGLGVDGPDAEPGVRWRFDA